MTNVTDFAFDVNFVVQRLAHLLLFTVGMVFFVVQKIILKLHEFELKTKFASLIFTNFAAREI